MKTYTNNYQSIQDYQDMYEKKYNDPHKDNAQDFCVSLAISCIALVAVLMSIVLAGPSIHSSEPSSSGIGVSQTPQPGDDGFKKK